MSNVTRSARKALIWLVTIVMGLYALLASGVIFSDATTTPGLALDLAGGRQLIMVAVTEGGEEITQEDLETAVEIIRNRIDASGVAEAEITTQGADTILIGLPGNPSEATIDLVRQSAQLQFRPVLITAPVTPSFDFDEDPLLDGEETTDEGIEGVEGVEGEDATGTETNGVETEGTETEGTETEGTETEGTETEGAEGPAVEDPATDGTEESDLPQPDPETTSPSSLDWLNVPGIFEAFEALDCNDPANVAGASMGEPNAPHVACDITLREKYVLGPVEMDGSDIASATSGPELNEFGQPRGGFATSMTFTSEGGRTFDQIANRLFDLDGDQGRFAMVLDGAVISAPNVLTRNFGGQAQITGSFTPQEAENLANQLQFGALPLSLELQTNEQVSASLGAESLRGGIIAGIIGLLLVFVYSFMQYRVLGLVTMMSLLIAGGTTFALISLLSWGIDYRLSLAGVAGLIVAVGITTDSFIVYFERIRDELRSGRSLSSAIDHAWRRARRTILASDVISLLAAVTLYMLAVGGVRGFAFTLGLVTFVDVLVVFLFTHPTMVLLSKTKFFGEGHKLSGLDPKQLGRESIYKGRGRVKVGPTPTMTLAERKAAAAKGEQ